MMVMDVFILLSVIYYVCYGVGHESMVNGYEDYPWTNSVGILGFN